MAPMSKRLTRPVAVTTVAASASTISAPVTYGRVSGAIPGISSRRSRLSVGAFGRPRRRRVRGSSAVAPRSIFGARLRTR